MRPKGFTLIEIIIAMVIIGILVTAASLNYEKVRAKSRDSKRKSDISNLAIALDSYYSFEKKYPGERRKDYHVITLAGGGNAWQDPPKTELEAYVNPLPVEQGPDFGDSFIGDNPCVNNAAGAGNMRNYNYITEDCAAGGGGCPTELVGGYILIARLELYDDPDVSTTAQTGCGVHPVTFGTNTTRNDITGHPLFILSK